MTEIRRYKPRRVIHFDWSAQLAYAAGLLATDGCLSSDMRHVYFVSQDIEQITNLQMCLLLKSKLGLTRNKTSEVYRLSYSNVQLFDWLSAIGLTPNKSLTLGPIEVPNVYFKDFLRGHLDGDGSITTYLDTYNSTKKPQYIYQRLVVRFISASKDHLEWLHNNIRKDFGVTGAFHITTKVNGNSMFTIKFGKNESLRLLSQLYYSDSIPCLSRKKSVYTNFVNTQ